MECLVLIRKLWMNYDAYIDVCLELRTLPLSKQRVNIKSMVSENTEKRSIPSRT